MPGDSLYWSPAENDTDESYQEKEPYIDPWDLENYAYIREHLESMELSSNTGEFSGSSGEFAEASQSFDYVPGKKRTGPSYMSNVREEPRFDSLLSDQGNYAAIEEFHQNDMRDRRTRSETYWHSRRRIIEESESDAEEVSPYAEGSVQGNPVFGIYDEEGVFRRVALPMTLARSQKDRSMSFTYGDYEYDPYSSKTELYNERSLDRRDSTLPIYDDVGRNGRKKPKNFSLNKYGHLKIDYSCSWNNLNKYMKYN